MTDIRDPGKEGDVLLLKQIINNAKLILQKGHNGHSIQMWKVGIHLVLVVWSGFLEATSSNKMNGTFSLQANEICG